jgi:hypothetical protein
MKYILLVTWFTYSQPPTSYQTVFNSAEACEQDRVAIMKEAERLLNQFRADYASAQARGVMLAPASAPPKAAMNFRSA